MTTDFVRKPCGFLFLINIFRDSGKYYVGTVSSVVDSHINTAAEEPAMGCTVSHIFCSLPLMFLFLFPCLLSFSPLLVLHSIFLSAFGLNQHTSYCKVLNSRLSVPLAIISPSHCAAMHWRWVCQFESLLLLTIGSVSVPNRFLVMKDTYLAFFFSKKDMSLTFFLNIQDTFQKRNSTGFDFYHFSLLILSNIVLSKNNSSPAADFRISFLSWE